MDQVSPNTESNAVSSVESIPMPTLIGPPMQPPPVPLMTQDDQQNIAIIIDYLYSLFTYLAEYRPTVES